MTDYTGPTNIIERETGFHIEGYPDAARYVQLDTILFRRLADLRMHQSALRLCEAGMQAFGALEDKRSDGARLMLTGVVASFFSCFGQNNASLSLSSDRVFKGKAEAKSAYKYWKALRNKLIIHNESGYCTQITGIVLGKNSEVQDILSTQIMVDITGDEVTHQNLYQLIVDTQKYVGSEIDALLPRVFEQARLMPAEKRAALPDVRWVVPGPEE
jgi:hypothetical protein